MTTLRQGDRGPAVLELQMLLRMTGHDPGPLDGVFGPRTWLASNDLLVKDPHWPATSREVTDANLTGLRTLPRRAVELSRILTPISAVDMRIALVAGYEVEIQTVEEAEMVGSGAMTNAVRVALAHLAVEHGCESWRGPMTQELDEYRLLPPTWLQPKPAEQRQVFIAVWCNNIGNRQVRHEDRGFAQSGPEMPTVPWFGMAATEGSGASARRATSAHYAYPNAAEGAAAYWRFLRDHYAHALPAFEAGDPEAAARLLKGFGRDGGPFAVGDLVALIGDRNENRRGRVIAIVPDDHDGPAEARVDWSGRGTDWHRFSDLRQAWWPYYTGSLKDYTAGMRDRFRAFT